VDDKDAMSILRIITSVVDNKWKLEMNLEPGAIIPTDIFLYDNLGTGLGEYFGVCSAQDYKKYQTFQQGVDIPVFGNKYLKHNVGIFTFNIERDPLIIKGKVIADVKSFKETFNMGQSTTSTHNI
jgi:hypothetical protein